MKVTVTIPVYATEDGDKIKVGIENIFPKIKFKKTKMPTILHEVEATLEDNYVILSSQKDVQKLIKKIKEMKNQEFA